MRDLAMLTATDFETALDSVFQVVATNDHETLPLSLVQVTRLPERPGYRPPFSLRWTGPPSPILAQGTHHLTHPEMGDMEIFLSPIAADATAATYQAVFG